LNEQSSIEKYGSAYSELRTNSKAAVCYNVFYMIRRLWITLVVLVIYKNPTLQVQLILAHNIIMIIYLTYVRPFQEPLLNNLEIFNEFSILIASYHLHCFTDFVPDPEI